MRFLPLPDGSIRLRLDNDEASILDQLTGQLIHLLQSHSGTALDPDPLFASLEVGGTDSVPEDPALARLFPDAYGDDQAAGAFRKVTEQGLVNRKMQDAIAVSSSLGLSGSPVVDEQLVEVMIDADMLPAWVRTLTALRLAIAARVGLTRESDYGALAQDEEVRGTLLVYDWLAAILDSLLRISPPGTVAKDDEEDPRGETDADNPGGADE